MARGGYSHVRFCPIAGRGTDDFYRWEYIFDAIRHNQRMDGEQPIRSRESRLT